MRKNGKVVKIELYLGTSIPGNIEQIKREFQQLIKQELYEKLERIKQGFAQNNKKISIDVQQKQLKEWSVSFTYHTNAIEGSSLTRSETRALLIDGVATNRSLSDIKESENHHNVFLQAIDNFEPLSEELLLRWHKELFWQTKQEIAGSYREVLVRVGTYIPPDWQDVPKLMKKFVKELHSTTLHPVEKAARAHYRFEAIHPFQDGNGRVGRLLMNYLLWHEHYPPLIIEYQKRASYYRALKNEEAFVKYFMRQYLSAHKQFLTK